MKDISKIALLAGLVLLIVVLSRFDFDLGFNLPIWVAIGIVVWLILRKGSCCKNFCQSDDEDLEETPDTETKTGD